MKNIKINILLFGTLLLVGCGSGDSSDSESVTIAPPPVQAVDPLFVTVAVQGDGHSSADISVFAKNGSGVLLSGSNNFQYAGDGAYIFDIYALQDELEAKGLNHNSPIIFEVVIGDKTYQSLTVASYFTVSGNYLLVNQYTDFFAKYAEDEVIESHNDITDIANDFFSEVGFSDSNLDGVLDYTDIGLFNVEYSKSELLGLIDEYYDSTQELNVVSYVKNSLTKGIEGTPFIVESTGADDVNLIVGEASDSEFYYAIEESCPQDQSVTLKAVVPGKSYTFTSGCALSYSTCYDEELTSCGRQSYLYNDSGLVKADSILLDFGESLSGISKSILQSSAAQLRNNSEFIQRLDDITGNEAIGDSLKSYRICKLFAEFDSHCYL